MTRIEALRHQEEILEASACAVTFLIGRGIRQGKIKILRGGDGPPTIDWKAAAAYLEDQPEYWKATSETQLALERLQGDFEESEPCH